MGAPEVLEASVYNFTRPLHVHNLQQDWLQFRSSFPEQRSGLDSEATGRREQGTHQLVMSFLVAQLARLYAFFLESAGLGGMIPFQVNLAALLQFSFSLLHSQSLPDRACRHLMLDSIRRNLPSIIAR